MVSPEDDDRDAPVFLTAWEQYWFEDGWDKEESDDHSIPLRVVRGGIRRSVGCLRRLQMASEVPRGLPAIPQETEVLRKEVVLKISEG